MILDPYTVRVLVVETILQVTRVQDKTVFQSNEDEEASKLMLSKLLSLIAEA